MDTEALYVVVVQKFTSSEAEVFDYMLRLMCVS